MQPSLSSGRMNVMTRALGSSLGNPNYQGPFGNTLLHGAVVSGDLREVKRLLAAGADPRIANRDGKTPVQAAALLGYVKIQGLLQKAKPVRR
jgi:ankyrin repeat protein